MARRVHSSERLEAFYRPGSSRFLLITFNEMGLRANGADYWARTLVDALDISCLGLVTREPNWFPADDTARLVESVQPILAAHDERITYGASMGGYAALRFAGAMRARTAVAYCPQVSIDPGIVGSYDRRFPQFFDPGLHRDMAIRPDHLAEASWVFFDPHQTEDAGHWQAIAPLGTPARPVHPVAVPFAGHHVAVALAGSASFFNLIIAIRDGDIRITRRIARRAGKRFRFAPAQVALVLERRGWFRTALPWAEAAIEAAPTDIFPLLAHSRICFALGLHEASLCSAKRARQHGGQHAFTRVFLSQSAIRSRNLPLAIEEAEAAVSLAPDNAEFRQHLTNVRRLTMAV